MEGVGAGKGVVWAKAEAMAQKKTTATLRIDKVLFSDKRVYERPRE